jgi:tyrosinase
MVERFHTDPVELPDPGHRISRVDLVVYGIDPSGESYEGRIFIGKKPPAGAGPDHPSYAGSFYVFGHGECWGEEGHCEVPTERDAFDLRLPHHLEPQVAIVTVTDHIVRLIGERTEKAPVTVAAYDADGSPVGTLAFSKLRLLTYA